MKIETLSLKSRLVDAVQAIESSQTRFTAVVSEGGHLLGTLTDGDIRRCLLSGGQLDIAISAVMNTAPVTVEDGASEITMRSLMKENNILVLPIIDAGKKIVRFVHLSDLIPEKDAGVGENGFEFAVIMAGGEGLRLRPITEHIPKPMVEIGGVPLLERLVQKLYESGVRNIYISVNYLSHVIEDYFGDGSKFNVDIRYLHEKTKLGTGGALAFLAEKPKSDIIVLNGDILTSSNFDNLFDFHVRQGADITVAAVDYRMQVPFGVIQYDGAKITGLEEKPVRRFFCNAGIYAISPSVMSSLSTDEKRYDMTDLIEDSIAAGKNVAVFPLHEYWDDIGTLEGLDKAIKRYVDR